MKETSFVGATWHRRVEIDPKDWWLEEHGPHGEGTEENMPFVAQLTLIVYRSILTEYACIQQYIT